MMMNPSMSPLFKVHLAHILSDTPYIRQQPMDILYFIVNE